MKLLLILTLLVGFNSLAMDTNFVRAIHLTESGGKLGAIKGDNGLALGPLQIHKSYWQDSRTQGSYSMVTNLDYSVKVMQNYMLRYCPKALKANDFHVMARVHNGGPLGYKKSATLNYWRKVKSNLTK